MELPAEGGRRHPFLLEEELQHLPHAHQAPVGVLLACHRAVSSVPPCGLFMQEACRAALLFFGLFRLSRLFGLFRPKAGNWGRTGAGKCRRAAWLRDSGFRNPEKKSRREQEQSLPFRRALCVKDARSKGSGFGSLTLAPFDRFSTAAGDSSTQRLRLSAGILQDRIRMVIPSTICFRIKTGEKVSCHCSGKP